MPHYVYKWLHEPDEVGIDEKRGCIASAYQASRHSGSTLQANLDHCDKL